jgi:tRNA threonylcarbamoyl adenosine modification protein (Sua5/YciO/YrdC/YwlC family)
VSEHLYTHVDPPNERHLERISRLLQNDGVIAIPTETSWAFCCDARSRKAQQRIQLLKPTRPESQPFSLICDSISMAASITKIGNKSYRSLKQILPGPFTVILQSSSQLPKRLKDKRANVGIRIPDEKITVEIIRYYGHPLTATSVPGNKDEQVLRMGYEVHDEYGHGIDLVIDIGEELPGTVTTILDFTKGGIDLIRLGAGDPEVLINL